MEHNTFLETNISAIHHFDSSIIIDNTYRQWQNILGSCRKIIVPTEILLERILSTPYTANTRIDCANIQV